MIGRGNFAHAAISLLAAFSLLAGCGSNLEGTGTRTKSLEIVGGMIPAEPGTDVANYQVEDTQSDLTSATTDDKGRFDIELIVTGTFASLRFTSPAGRQSEVAIADIPENVTIAAAIFNVKAEGHVELSSIDFDSGDLSADSNTSSDPAISKEDSSQKDSNDDTDEHNGGTFESPHSDPNSGPPDVVGPFQNRRSENDPVSIGPNGETGYSQQADNMTDTSTIGSGTVHAGGNGNGSGIDISSSNDGSGAGGSQGGSSGGGRGNGSNVGNQTAGNMQPAGTF